ncbi:AAA family ATPase [Mesomycoplasma neurolyticum]|uniref:Chromosome partition protein Smc n=1 Tax=Mesomycoplasma neurolyticum TaxID=2120 RepID=A0A449A4V9_9BACT|nr:AAA family ATPase [Mesomycoplasma neurolyticum]VEU59269.1 ABC transporter ATP-binding protein [Mesomycoplasma neurolyticum]
MKLIKVEAQGFKSFADRVVLNFDGGVVGIIGPNGSGKSNINDAIKWVLGEQSSKALRGDKMEDVIFAGSKTMRELNKAEVILTFDNSDKAVSIPHDIFTISRVLHRGKGGNEYYINGEIARYRDIKEIAMESGISKSSLAIISQGTISDIAEASPEQRRAIIEEAAGTSKYKARKIEALRKLESTEEALSKIRLIINEIEKRLSTLSKQAEKAKTFIEKTDALKSIEVGLIVEDLTFYNNQILELNKSLENAKVAKQELETERELLIASFKQNSESKIELEVVADKMQSELSSVEKELHTLEIRQTKINQRRQDIIDGLIEASPKEQAENLQKEISQIEAKINQYRSYEENTQQKVVNVSEKAKEVELELIKTTNEKHKVFSFLEAAKARLKVLEEYKNNRSNLFKGTKVILEHASLFKGLKGAVIDLIKTDKEFSAAIETTLANALQHVVVDNSETAVKAVNFLKQNKAGWATFIPLNSIQPREIRHDHLMALKTQKGFVAMAHELVETTKEFEKLKLYLLGNVIVAKTIEDANSLSKLIQLKYMVVTLDGDVIRPGGIMTGGSKDEKQNSLLKIDQDIEQIKAKIPTLNEQKQALDIKEQKILQEKNMLISSIGELNDTVKETRNKRVILMDRSDELKVKFASISSSNFEIAQIDELAKQIVDLEVKKNELETNLKITKSRINVLTLEMQPSLEKKTQVENDIYHLNNQISKNETNLEKANYLISQNQKRLTEHYQMTLENAQESYKLEADIDEARKIVEELKKEIKALGNVNLDSIKEFEEQEERYNNLKENEEELSNAKNIILEAIAEMDKIIVNKIQETVDIVNREFKNVFMSMFGGGNARVQYSDPENILETGIEIFAQPPGKTIKNLKLFSGGEKAIIAISLLFAIIKAKPIPLCILDEVEAALDEANVIRYAEFLQSLKDKTQFIVITHRHGTMTKVDHLFGATMQKRGVTSFFSVEISKAKELLKNQIN